MIKPLNFTLYVVVREWSRVRQCQLRLFVSGVAYDSASSVWLFVSGVAYDSASSVWLFVSGVAYDSASSVCARGCS
jgi:hypothetical protein